MSGLHEVVRCIDEKKKEKKTEYQSILTKHVMKN